METASKLELVRNSALAAELSGDQCSVLAELVAVRDLGDGEILFKQGASDNRLYAVVSGALAVSRESDGRGSTCTCSPRAISQTSSASWTASRTTRRCARPALRGC